MELIFELLGEFLLQVIFELLFDSGVRSVRNATGRRKRAHPAMAAGGIILLAVALGVVAVAVVPQRMFPAPPVPGASLLLAPLGAGALMHTYGKWQVRRGGMKSWLATFWGGALFAFVFSLTRLLLVAR